MHVLENAHSVPGGALRLSEIAPVLANNTIRYSQVWEDHRVLERALDIGPDDDVLSITSAGDNALALLLQEPRSVTAIDLNPAQNHLLHLKLAAIKSLDFGSYVELLGARPSCRRANLLTRVAPYMPEETAAFWFDRREFLDVGLLACGRLDTYFTQFRDRFLRLVPNTALDALLLASNLAEQRSAFERVCESGEIEELFRWYFGREMMAKQGRDPAQFKYVENEDVGAYFFSRFRYACAEMALPGNFYVEFFLTGQYRDLELAPPYLRPSSFAKLRSLVDRVKIVEADLEGYVSSMQQGTFSKLKLSNIFEYISDSATASLFAALGQWVRPNGRIAYWNFLVPRSSNEMPDNSLVPLAEQAYELWRQDRSWVYRAFHLEEVTSQ